jgi:hypothetical protein
MGTKPRIVSNALDRLLDRINLMKCKDYYLGAPFEFKGNRKCKERRGGGGVRVSCM